MATDKYNILRKILRAIGLSEERVDELVATIQAWLADDQFDAQPAATPKPPPLPYHLRDDFLSAAEANFYHVLKNTVADWAVVMVKVSLGDLFYAASGDYGQNRIWRNRIDRKHLDFLLCDPQTMQPLLGIELDDRSHNRPERQQRDQFVDLVFNAARLPLVHVPVRFSYTTTELDDVLRAKAGRRIREVARVDEVMANQPASNAPTCPKCGALMVQRIAQRGRNAGNTFWGCPNYPRCKGILQLLNG